MAQDRRLDFTVGVKADQASFNKLQTQITNLMLSYQKVAAKGGMTEDLKKSMDAAKQLQSILNKSYNSALGSYNMNTFQNELNKAGGSLEKLKANLEASGHGGAATFNNLGSTLLQSNKQITKANKLTTDLFETFKRTAKWGISSSIFHNLTSELSQAVSFAERLDSSLNDIRIVTGASAKDMKEVAAWANQAAKNLSASTIDLSDAALIFYQQGDTGKEAQRKAEITTKVANVTGQDTATAADEMTAVWNGYQAATNEMESYADKMAKVAATTASDFEELSTGMQKVASTGNMMGVSFDQLTAQMSTIISVTREAPESVGTALKTVYARMGDLAVKGQSTDEDGFTTKLGTVTSAMDKMGIQILDAQGNMRDMGTIMEDVGKKWQSWSKAEQTAAATTLAGKRQYTQLTALFDNWDKYVKAKSVSESAEGTLNEQQDIYADRLTSTKKTLEATKESIYNDLLNTDAIIPAIKAMTTFADSIDKIVKSLGGGTTAILAFGAVLTKVFSKQIGNEIGRVGRNFTARASNLSREHLAENQIQIRSANADKDLEQWKEARAKIQNVSSSSLARQKASAEMEISANRYVEGKSSAARYEKELEYTKLLNKYENLLTDEEKEQLKIQKEANVALAEKLAKEKAENELIKNRYEDDSQDKVASLEGDYEAYERVMRSYEAQTNHIGEGRNTALAGVNDSYSEIIQNDYSFNNENLDKYFDDIYKTIAEFDENLVNNYKIELEKIKEKIRNNIKDNVDELNEIYKNDNNNINHVSKGHIRALYQNADNDKLNQYKEAYSKQLESDSITKEKQQALQKEIETIDRILELRQQINKATEETANAVNNVAEAQQQEIANEQNEYEQNVETYQTNQANIESDNNANEANEEGFKDFNTSLEGWQKIGDTIDIVTNSVSGVIMAFTNFNSLFDIWTDDKLSFWDKLGESISILAFTLPTLISSVSTLNGLFPVTAASGTAAAAAEGAVAAGGTAAGVGTAAAASGVTALGTAIKSLLGPVGIALAIGGVVLTVIASIVKHLKKQKEEQEHLNNVYEQTTNAINGYSNSLSQLNSKYDELASSIDKLKSAKDTFDSLEKGTAEWTKALADNNNIVLGLISQYKDLAQYVTTDENGFMTIDPDALANKQKEIAEKQADTVAKQGIAQAQNSNQEAKKQYEDTVKEESKNFSKQMQGLINDDAFKEVYNYLTKNNLAFNKENIEQVIGEGASTQLESIDSEWADKFVESLQKIEEANNEYIIASENATQQLQTAITQKLENNSGYKDSKFKDALGTTVTEDYNEKLEEETKNNLKKYNNMSDDEQAAQIAKYLSESTGTAYSASDLTIKDGEITYKEGKDAGISNVQEMLDTMGSYYAQNTIDKQLDSTISSNEKVLEKAASDISKSTGASVAEVSDALNKFVSSGGSTEGISSTILKGFEKANITDTLNKQLKGVKIKFGKENIDDKNTDNKTLIEELNTGAKEEFSEKSEAGILSLSKEQQKTFSKNFAAGDTNNDKFNDAFHELYNNNEKYAEQISVAFAGIDTSSPIAAMDQFKENLKEQGITYSDLVDKNGQFATSMADIVEAMEAANNVIPKTKEELLNVFQLFKDVEQGDEINSDDYKKLEEFIGKKKASEYFTEAGNGKYSANENVGDLKAEIRNASGIDNNPRASKSDKKALASTYDSAHELLGTGLDMSTIYNQAKVIQNKMVKDNKTTNAEIDNQTKAIKNQIKTRKEELTVKKNKSKSEKEELQNLQKITKSQKELNQAATVYATAAIEEDQALTDLGKNWKKYYKYLTSANEGSEKFQKASIQVKDSLQNIFGSEDVQIKDFIDDKFVKNHAKIIDKMLKGDEEAYETMRKHIAKEFTKHTIYVKVKAQSGKKEAKRALKEFNNIIDKMPSPEVGIKLDKSYQQQLNDMMQEFNVSANTIQSWLNSIGYKGTLKTKYKKITVKDTEANRQLYGQYGTPTSAGNGKITVNQPILDFSNIEGTKTKKKKNYINPDSSSKSGRSSKKPEQASPIKNTYDAYEKWEELIERINTKLSILQKKQEHLTGKELVKNLEKQAALLVKIRSLREKERQEADKQLDKTNRKVKRFTSGKLSKKYNNLGLKRKDYIGIDDDGNETFDDEQYLEDFANAYEKKWRDSKTGKWKELKTKSQKQANKKDKQSYDYIKKILDERDNALKKQNEQDEAYQEAFNQTVSKYIEIHDAGTQIIEDAKEIRDTFNQLNLDKLEMQLTRLQNGLTRLQNKANQLVGAAKIENYNKQNENLREQIKNSQDTEKTRREQAKDDAKDMQKVIDNSVNNAGASKYTKEQLKDVKVETDESGLITNSKEIANQYNKTLKGLDPKIKAKEAEIKNLRKQKKNAKTAKKKNEIQRKIEKAQTELAMMKGDKTNLKSDLSTIQSDSTSNSDNVKEAEAEVANQDSYQQQISENLFAKFEYSWTIKVDDAEAKQKIKQLGIDLTKALSTDVDGGELQSLFGNIAAQKEVDKVYLDEAESYRAKIQEILDAQARGEKIDDNQLQSYIDKLNEISDNIESSISTAINNITSLYSSIDTTVKANLEIYQDLSNWLSASDNMSEAFNTILSTFKENGSLRGWQNNNLQNKITNASILSALKMDELTAQTNLYKTTKAEYDSFLAKEAKGEALTEQEQSAKKADKLTLDSTKEVIQQDVNEVITQALNIYQNKLTLLTNKINDNVEEAFKTINGQFLKDAQEIFNWLQNTSKRYYDRTERPFQISSYGTYANKLMSNTNNIEYQERLKKVYNEQLKILREKDKLSQYDVDRAKKLLDLEIKRQALEDARNNKTNLKLRRDQSGNYSYQYIADPSKVADAQANLEQAKNDVYELDKTNLATSLNNYFSDSQAMQEELKNAYKNAAKDKEGNIIDQASFDAEIKNIKEKYQDVVVSNAQDVLTRFNNFKQSSGLNWNGMTEAQQNSALRAAGFDPDIIKSALQNNSIEKWNNFFNNNFGSGSEYYKNNQDLITSTQEINKQLIDVNAYLKAIVGDVTQEDKTQFNKNNTNLSTIISETKTEISNLVTETQHLITAYKENNKTQTDAQNNSQDNIPIYTRNSIDEANVGTKTNSANDIINNLNNAPTETKTFDVVKNKYIKKGTEVYDGMNNHLFTVKDRTSIIHIGYVKGTLGPHQQIKINSGKFAGREGFVKKNQIVGLKSGGYTGDWSDTSIDKDNGKLAWLHQKELVLNANDTENMLNAVGLVRDISSLLYNMNTSAFSRATDLMSNLYQRFGSAAGGNSNIIQNINIDADFPGVKDAIQIERAFKNLSNIALQKSSNSTTISNAISTL